MNKVDIIEYVHSVILSCKTLQQLVRAKDWAINVIENKIHDPKEIKTVENLFSEKYNDIVSGVY